MKLSSKVHLYSSVLMAVLLLVMNLSIYFVFSRMTLDSQLKQADAEANRIAQGLIAAAGAIPTADLLRGYVPVDGLLRVIGPDQNGPAPVISSSQLVLAELELPYAPDKRAEIISYAGGTYSAVSLPVIWPDGAVMNVQVVRSLQATMDNLQVLRIVLIVVSAAVLLPVIASTRVLARVIMQPISALTRTMREIRSSGRFRRIELDPKSKDELVEMGAAFNDMITLLERNYEKQEQFVSNASHELKTPITIIESYASLLKRRGLDRPELFHESVEAIHSEAVRMKELTEQLLLLARNRDEWQVKMEDVDLVELCEASAGAFRSAYHREVQVRSDQGAVYGWTDRQRLRQLLFIFLDNARKYSEEAVTVDIQTAGGQASIRITDRGIGIPKEELPYVFDRFYRVDEARSRKGGAGLGLSLAKDIAEAIEAELELDSLPGVGTTAVIRLKLAE
ncbi:HAMP domain-containing sensor histidine kinase [Paenibacillus sp. FSL M8-0334]|uniref:sensor histidine kinase n=1 Tax=Paenibacillus sp. FSL M8-0334 TaxID=2921623 RepID=UPI0030F93DFA